MFRLTFPKLAFLVVLSLLFAAPAAAQFVPAPSLEVSKTHTGAFARGGSGKYVITVTNAGAGATTAAITVTDTLPAGLTYVSATGEDFICAEAAGIVTCTRSTPLAGGSSVIIDLVVDVEGDAAASVTNEVSVSGGGGAVPGRPTADPTAILDPGLEVTKAVDKTSARVGNLLTYTITVTNATANPIADVQLRDALHPSVAFVSAEPDAGTCTSTAIVGCDLGVVAAGGSVQVVIVVEAVQANVVWNEASAWGRDVADVVSQQVVTSVVARPHVEILKGVTGVASAGQTVTYTIAVTNAGPGPVTNAVITDVLPSSLALLEVDAPAGMSCVPDAPPTVVNPGTVKCSIAEIADDGTVVLKLRLQVLKTGAITNTACIEHDDTDPNAKAACSTARLSDPGFNPPEDSLPPAEDDEPEPIAATPTPNIQPVNAGPTPTPTVMPAATAVSGGDAPATSTAGARTSGISPPSTGNAGLR